MVEIIWCGPRAGMCVVRGRLHEEPMADLNYITGRKPPNYPVPALPMDVRIGQPSWRFTLEWTIQHPTHELVVSRGCSNS